MKQVIQNSSSFLNCSVRWTMGLYPVKEVCRPKRAELTGPKRTGSLVQPFRLGLEENEESQESSRQSLREHGGNNENDFPTCLRGPVPVPGNNRNHMRSLSSGDFYSTVPARMDSPAAISRKTLCLG